MGNVLPHFCKLARVLLAQVFEIVIDEQGILRKKSATPSCWANYKIAEMPISSNIT
jgi:hypothetical protein